MSHRTAGRQRFERRAHPQRPQGDQSALLVAATRRGPAVLCDPSDAKWIAAMQPVSRAVASHLTDDRLADRAIGFADVPAEDPDLLSADPQPAEQPRGIDPAPLREGHEHAETVLRDLRAETSVLDPRPADEHMTHHQQPKAWLRTVPLVDPVGELCDSVELAIARFACAVSDLAIRPGGAYLVANLAVTTVAVHLFRHDWSAIDWDALKPPAVSMYDRRPLGAPVGRELSEVAA